jgi:DNA recombination protein RmuC
MSFLLSNEMALIEVSILVVLITVVICFIIHLRAVSRLARNIDVSGSQASLVSQFEKSLRDANDEVRKGLGELDQGLRSAISIGMKDGLVTAFEQVKAGMLAQTNELSRFGSTLKEDIGTVKTEVSTLSEKVTAALTGMTGVLNEKLSAAELAAADGRSILLRDTAAAILRAREEIDLSLKKFGTEQETRLSALDVTVKESGIAVQAILGAFKTTVVERLDHASEATNAALKLFGEQQGLHLESIAKTVKDGGEASHTSQAGFRKEVTERLDAISIASASLLKQATDTFTDIKSAIVASEEKTTAALASQHLTVLGRLAQGQLEVSEKLTKDLGELMRLTKEGFDLFSGKLREEQEQLRGLVGTKLEEMRAGNEAKLEDMRKAVDEKLQSALEKQIGESFQRIADQFAAVQQAIGQVQSVAGQVGDLKRLFSNVKSRGGWGEAQAEAMLQDMLPVGAYEKNMKVREGSSEFVEFAVRIPGKNGEDKWIPIDSKFPTEDYERLLTANEMGNRDEEATARLGLERRIKMEAERIGSKYIFAPKTVDFALLYLPSDSLFAEVARSPGLIELIRRDHKIMIMGPSLLPAFLHTINIGYMTVALERNVSEIGETLSAVKSEWGKLLPWLDRIADRTDSLKKGIEAVQQRARAVGRKLRSVDVIDHARADAVLGLDAPSFVQDAIDEAAEGSDEIALN